MNTVITKIKINGIRTLICGGTVRKRTLDTSVTSVANGCSIALNISATKNKVVKSRCK